MYFNINKHSLQCATELKVEHEVTFSKNS